MKIDIAKRVFDIINGSDIKKCAILDAGETNQIRGISEDRTTIIFTEVPKFIEKADVGIISVPSLLSRLNLFDEQKAKVAVNVREGQNGDYISSMVVSEGRRRSTVKTNDPENMKGEIPKKYPEAKTMMTIYMETPYIRMLDQMRSSIKTVAGQDDFYIRVGYKAGSENEIDFSICGGNDDFDDVLESYNIPDNSTAFSASYQIDSFMRVFKKAASIEGEAKILVEVNSLGVMEVDVGGIRVSLVPISTN